jgi:hypothetical protein
MGWKSAFLERTKADLLEYTILYVGGIISICILITPFYFPFDFQFFSGGPNSGIANTVAQILATIFAITISLSLLGVEYFSQELTPRIIPSLIRSRFIQTIVASYVLSIPIVLFSKYSLQTPLQLALIFSLLVWALCCLLSYVVFIGMRLNPMSQARFLRKQLPEDFDDSILRKVKFGSISIADSDDRIIDMQNIILQALSNRNIFTFAQWLILVFNIENEYLSKRFIEYKTEGSSYSNLFEEMGEISSYFGFIHSLLLSEIRSKDNIRFLRPYVRLLEFRAERAIRMKNYNVFGKDTPTAKNESSSASKQFLNAFLFTIKYANSTEVYREIFDNYFDAVLKSIMESESYMRMYSDIPSREDRTEYEDQRIRWGRIIERHYNELLREIHRYCTNIDLDESSEAISAFDWSLSRLAGKIIESDGGIELRKQLLSTLTYYHGVICLMGHEYEGYIFTSYLNMITLHERAKGEDNKISDENIELLMLVLDRIEEYINALDDVERYMDVFSPLTLEAYENNPEIVKRTVEISIDYLEKHEGDDLNLTSVIEKAVEDFESVLSADEVEKIESIIDD